MQKLAFAAVLFLSSVSIPPAVLAQGEQEVAVTASDVMKYNLTAIAGKVGDPMTITLTNKGTLPKVAMAHNLVILKPGTDTTAFVLAAARHSADNYLPTEQADKIIVATKLLGPGESDTITFLPSEAGSYPFVCTFPGHALSGMRGTITVQ